MARNLQTLGVLWLVLGAYRLITGLIGMFFLSAIANHTFGQDGWPFLGHFPEMPAGWMAVVVPFLGFATIVSAGLAFATGYSLMTRRPWGRTLAIVAAVLALLKFPFGTAMGVYTLWVMAPRESGLEYEALAV